MVNDHAHETLVTPGEFEAAQDAKPYTHRRNGFIAAQVMLVGLIKCAGCGHNLRDHADRRPRIAELDGEAS